MSRVPFNLKIWPAQVNDVRVLVNALISIRNSLNSTGVDAAILSGDIARRAARKRDGEQVPDAKALVRRRVARRHAQRADFVSYDVARAVSSLDSWINELKATISEADAALAEVLAKADKPTGNKSKSR